MAFRDVVKNDMEFLTKKSRPVTEFDDRLKLLVEDMKDTLTREAGVGLAAPQVGVLRRLFIVDFGEEGQHDFKLFVNPEILKMKGSNHDYMEGCLSFPGRTFDVGRPNMVKVKAQDVKGDFFELTAEGFMARAIMHENDHLNGIVLPISGEEILEN